MVAHFDLAAFYDTISHAQLVRVASPRGGDHEMWSRVRAWLQAWTRADDSPSQQHGIPQGPIASNFLAEAFFLPIDERMAKLPVRYTRYVDDIRIFAKTATDAQKASVQLELACRNHGLIPQGKKFAIMEATSLDEVMGHLPSIPPEGEEEPAPMATAEAETLFREALEGRPLRVKDKSRLRYVLYRAPASGRILNHVLKLMERHPEHIDAFAHYLSNYTRGRRIERVLSNTLRGGVPYGYVRGELWHVISRLGSRDILGELRPVAREDAHTPARCVAWSWGLINFFMRCHRERLCRYGRLLRSAPPLARALLVPKFEHRLFDRRGMAADMIANGEMAEGIAVAREMRKRGLRLSDLGLTREEVSVEMQNVLKGLGVIQRRSRAGRDYIGERLTARFGTPRRMFWQDLFADNYHHALQILLEAEGAFDMDRSHWLQLQNSFNDALARSFIAYLKAKTLAGVVLTVARGGRLVKFGSIVQGGSSFDRQYPRIAGTFRDANHRRNRLPGSHPYEEKGGGPTAFLKKREEDHLSNRIGRAYDEIVAVIDAHGPP